MRQCCLDTIATDIAHGYDSAAPGARILDLPGIAAAKATRAYLDHAANPGHLCGAAHGTAISVRVAPDHIGPVSMGIHLKYGVWSTSLKACKPGNWHGIIATQDYGLRARRPYSLGRFGDAGSVSFRISAIRLHIAAVHHAPGFAVASKQALLQVEIKLLELSSEGHRCQTKRIRRIGGMAGLVGFVGRRFGCAEYCNRHPVQRTNVGIRQFAESIHWVHIPVLAGSNPQPPEKLRLKVSPAPVAARRLLPARIPETIVGA